MDIHIDTQQAKSAVESIRREAQLLMRDCEHMLHNVKNIGRGMQTQMSDTVRTETTKVERDISKLKNEMQKLEHYTDELARYISNYNQCAYRGGGSGYYANVSTEDVAGYMRLTSSVSQSISNFRNTFEEECSYIVSKLDNGIYTLDKNHAECDGALTSLKEKIDHAEARLEELLSKLKQLEEKYQRLIDEIEKEQALMGAARARAAAVYIPPYRSWTTTDSDGNTTHHNNQAEIDAAMAERQRHLDEAAKHEARVAELTRQAEQVKKEIEATKQRIREIKDLLQQMRQTEYALQAHLAALKRSRDALYKCREEIKSIRASCVESCQHMQQECNTAQERLSNAMNALDGYASVYLNDPKLVDNWRLF